jgi:hypothetical protein
MEKPRTKLLEFLVSGFIVAIMFKPMVLLFRKEGTWFDRLNNFFVDSIGPYMFGAFTSGVTPVHWGAVICGVIFAVSVLRPGPNTAVFAKRVLVGLFLLSVFTIWIEPFLTVSGVAVQAASIVAKTSSKPVDLFFTVIWLLVLLTSMRHLDRYYPREVKPVPPQLKTRETAP